VTLKHGGAPRQILLANRYKQAEATSNDTMKYEFFCCIKTKKKKEKPAHKSKSVAAHPYNHPFAATHMLF